MTDTQDWHEVFDAQKSVIDRLRPPPEVVEAATRLNNYIGYYHGCHADIDCVAGWILALPAVLKEAKP